MTCASTLMVFLWELGVEEARCRCVDGVRGSSGGSVV